MVLTCDLFIHIWYCPLPFLVTVTDDTDLWPVQKRTLLPLTLSSHGDRWYWPTTFPGMYSIAPYPFWVCRLHHWNISLTTNLQFWFDSSDSPCVNSGLLFLLKPRQYISGIPSSHLCRIEFNWWDYRANISHCGRINSVSSTNVSLCVASVAYLISTINSICELVQQQFYPWSRQYFSEKVRQVGLCFFPGYSSGATRGRLSAHVVSGTVVLLPELWLWHRSILVHHFIFLEHIRQSVNWYTEHSEFVS